MPLPDALRPVAMQRVALVVPDAALRDALVAVADDGTVAFDDMIDGAGGTGDSVPSAAAGRGAMGRTGPPPALAAAAPDVGAWQRSGRLDLVAGEASLARRAERAVVDGRVAALVGWLPARALPALAARLRPLGGAAVPLPAPPHPGPPTLLASHGTADGFAPLVETYGTVPYEDVDPSLLAGLAYVAMFGMMFADVGHGLLLVLAACALRWSRWSRLSRLRAAWLFLLGAGVAGTVFGALYGEFFGPTGVVPVVWLAPLDHPVPLLLVAVAAGSALLAGAYALGTVNRVREGGWARALYDPTGVSGFAVFLGFGVAGAGFATRLALVVVAGAAAIGVGLTGEFAALWTAAGGGRGGVLQAAVELFDGVIRLGSNTVSFARLAAFGLTHAALCEVVWNATTGLWHRGPLGAVCAIAIFVIGNALTFALEGLIAAIQALRLEYYELFSRVFVSEGRPYRPWHIPSIAVEDE